MNYPYAIYQSADGRWSVATTTAVICHRVSETEARAALQATFPDFPLTDLSFQQPSIALEFAAVWRAAVSHELSALGAALDDFSEVTSDSLESLEDEVGDLQTQADDHARELQLVRLYRELSREEAREASRQQQLLDSLHTRTTPQWVRKQNAAAILGSPSPRMIELRRQIQELEE